MTTITLTNRRPVSISEDEWPAIADGKYKDWDNQYEFQANRTWKCRIKVRQHQDERVVVYGVYDYDTNVQRELCFLTKAGELLEPGDDIPSAINRVADKMRDAAEEAGRDFGPHISAAARDCIADLPPEEI
jgi:hypothetical protein